jgi:microcystin-dependent protein
MAKNGTLQLYRGTKVQNDAYKGAAGELTADMDSKQLRLHDGTTTGGSVIGGGGSALPVGAIIAAPLTTMLGFLLCDGSEVSRMTYLDLFLAIGTTFGEGDGGLTFNLPDYRGCFLRGLGGESAGDFATKQLDAAPNITGSITSPRSEVPAFTGTGVFTAGSYATRYAGGSGYSLPTSTIFNASKSSTSYGRDSTIEVRPTNFAINWFIKY